MTSHLSEQEIQQYAMDKMACDPRVVEHISSCPDCQLKAELYILMFTEFKEQPSPNFDFNLSEMVLAKLPQSKAETKRSDKTIIGLAIGGILSIGFAIFYSMEFKLAGFFSGIAMISIYLIITIVVLLCVFLGIDMYNKYQKQIRSLDLS